MSKFFVGSLLLFFSLVAGATGPVDVKPYNLLTFRQIDAGSPWLHSGNAAGLSQMTELFPSEINLDFENTNGNFHSVFEGQSDMSFNFSSKSFRKINRTFLYGSFTYSKSFEKGLYNSNTNDPGLNYPYLLIDNMGNDTYDREFFKLAGMISSPLNNKLDWGLNFDYKVGVASQNRDPRPENKVLQTNVSPGLLLKLNHFKLGTHLIYGYYNEDIDISVVAEGAQYMLFQIHGPGVYDYHVSGSFFRLYQQHEFGGGMQAGWNYGKISNMLHSNYIYSMQTIDDGRKASFATWSAVKNDARMDGVNWNLTDVLSIDRGEEVHQLKAMVHVTSKLGTEFIQRLERVGETDLDHWITYGKEQKYYSLKTDAELDYQLMFKDGENRMQSLFETGLGYTIFDEKYYLPNQELYYSNFKLKTSYLKLFSLAKSTISTEVKLKYQFNLNCEENIIESNLIMQNVYLPEMEYLMAEFVSTGISVSYQIPLQKAFGNYFIKSDMDWYHSTTSLNRTIFSFSTGIIF